MEDDEEEEEVDWSRADEGWATEDEEDEEGTHTEPKQRTSTNEIRLVMMGDSTTEG